MVRITIDERLKAELLASEGVVELCDESGKPIAKAIPNPPEIDDPWSLLPELSEEELRRRCDANESGIPNEEAKAYLMRRSKRP